MYRMEKFSSFLNEQKDVPYELLIVSHDGIDDVNETGPLIHKTAKKLGIKSYLAETMGSYMEETKDGRMYYSFPVDDKGQAELPNTKNPVDYQKGFEINPKTTLVMMRGLNPRASCESWRVQAKTLEHEGYKLVNSVRCNDICNDKWHNHIIFMRENIQAPKTFLVRHSEGSLDAAKKLNNKYPMILKTAVGSIGVGVMYGRTKTRLINDYGGLALRMPNFALIFMVFTMANIGLPGTSGFVGEFLSLLGAFKSKPWYVAFALIGVILSAAYALPLYKKIMFGDLLKENLKSLSDISFIEKVVLFPLLIATITFGILPYLLFQFTDTSVGLILKKVGDTVMLSQISFGEDILSMFISRKGG